MPTPCCEITISDAGSSLVLGPFGATGQFTLTCRNLLGRSFPGLVELVGLESTATPLPKWLSVPGKYEFDRDATVAVVVTAKLPPGEEAGKFQFRLRISNELTPNEEFAESRPISVQIESAKPPPAPKWLIPALIGGVVLTTGASLAVWLMNRTPKLKVTDKCDPMSTTVGCPVGLACDKSKSQCLVEEGGTCAASNECSSGLCATKKCAAIPIFGGACVQGGPPCPPDTACAGSKCLTLEGKSCKSDPDCISTRCDAQLCVAAPGDKCDPSTACPSKQTCNSDKCKLNAKQPCRSDSDCIVACGQNGLCVADNGDCDRDGDCPAGKRCLPQRLPGVAKATPTPGTNALSPGTPSAASDSRPRGFASYTTDVKAQNSHAFNLALRKSCQ